MRLGGFFAAQTTKDLEPLCEKMDIYGLSAIPAPGGLAGMTDDECTAFGEEARRLGMVVGEVGVWSNLMTADKDQQAQLIRTTGTMLRKADIMGCHAIMTLVGTKDPSGAPLAPSAYMYTDECKAEFREIVLRILDGLDLKKAMYVIEPWHNTFFYQPEDIREFIDSVGHPAFGLHLDQMNMVSQQTFYHTTDLINRTFDLLADKVASVHLKDVACDHDHMFLKLDEVYIGDGVMDYETYLKRLAELPPDTPCYCEHMMAEGDYALNFARLHRIAEKVGVRFLRRGE
jgi:sugar phosphate isomerase/epimerase